MTIQVSRNLITIPVMNENLRLILHQGLCSERTQPVLTVAQFNITNLLPIIAAAIIQIAAAHLNLSLITMEMMTKKRVLLRKKIVVSALFVH